MGDEDLSPNNRLALQEFSGVSFHDLFDFVDQAALSLKTWDMKPFALLFSSFTEAAMLDVDIGFLQSPDVLFSQIPYLATGTLFFRDRTLGDMTQNVPKVVKMLTKCPSDNFFNSRVEREISSHEMESGVVVADKSRAFLGLLGACKLMDRLTREYLYNMCGSFYGDKEFYWVGFEMAEQPYSFTKWFPGAIGMKRDVNVTFSQMFERIETIHDSRPSMLAYNVQKSAFFNKRKLLSVPEAEDEDQDDPLKGYFGFETVAKRLLKKQQKEKKIFSRVCGRMLHLDDEGMPLWWNGGFKYAEDVKADIELVPYLDMDVFDDGGNIDDPLIEISLWTFDGSHLLFCKDDSMRKVREIPPKFRDPAVKSIEAHDRFRNLNSSQLIQALQQPHPVTVGNNNFGS
eukprot:TRINITY_DN12194_c0_g2_i1.p1 TRINITY_DN12194_c0_g2~~TRINITY_DN12194_c0_g2_i1.p1  ORF type:complete len:470 (+),score=96.66 TRINITY_DN12194_c0_g2_i1:213-1412(+)